jgi:hypothetical protein
MALFPTLTLTRCKLALVFINRPSYLFNCDAQGGAPGATSDTDGDVTGA